MTFTPVQVSYNYLLLCNGTQSTLLVLIYKLQVPVLRDVQRVLGVIVMTANLLHV